MKDIIFDDFQNSVNECLIRHRSILDILTKLQESEARINRSVCKSVTSCGCLKIDATKQLEKDPKQDVNLDTLKDLVSSHLEGKPCKQCQDIIESEIGNHLFYLTCLCNLLDINVYDVLLHENNKLLTLGKYTLR
ncbi:DUF1573 domain-containing protein [Clostridiaceae bacterium 14S0207]|nr:DUF1573 domain-containing protein [Clostridiaceae bacterium 14S0207]